MNPSTPIEYGMEAASDVDFILLMSVNPGFGGQAFIPHVLDKARKLRTYLDEKGLEHVELEIDGGIKPDMTKEVMDAGINIIVSGSGIFSGDLAQNIAIMKSHA